ncbi:MAG: hypothetical protein F4X60_15140 [Gemmatimonadetes bacterium]|nr:hypothetical protein [Gemmatimonadota bacterium]
MDDRLDVVLPGRLQHGRQRGQVDRRESAAAVALVIVYDFHHVRPGHGQIGHLAARFLRRVDGAGGDAVLGAVPVRGGEAGSGRQDLGPLPALLALPVPEGQDHLFRTEEIEDEGHAGVEGRVRRPLGSQQLGHSGGGIVAEGVAVQVGQRRDDELAGQVQGLAGEVRGDDFGDAGYRAVLDEEDAVPDRFVGGVEDGRTCQHQILGRGGTGPR